MNKTIGDLFNLDLKGLDYEDVFVYVYNVYKHSIVDVFCDSGYDISLKVDDTFMNEDEYFRTIKLSDIAQVFCKNKEITRDVEIEVVDNDENIKVKRIDFDFDYSLIYLIL